MTEHTSGHAAHAHTTAATADAATTAPAASQSGFAAFVASVESDGEAIIKPAEEVISYVEKTPELAAAATKIKNLGLAFLEKSLPGVPVATIVTVLEGLLAEIAPTVAAIPSKS